MAKINSLLIGAGIIGAGAITYLGVSGKMTELVEEIKKNTGSGTSLIPMASGFDLNSINDLIQSMKSNVTYVVDSTSENLSSALDTAKANASNFTSGISSSLSLENPFVNTESSNNGLFSGLNNAIANLPNSAKNTGQSFGQSFANFLLGIPKGAVQGAYEFGGQTRLEFNDWFDNTVMKKITGKTSTERRVDKALSPENVQKQLDSYKSKLGSKTYNKILGRGSSKSNSIPNYTDRSVSSSGGTIKQSVGTIQLNPSNPFLAIQKQSKEVFA